MEHSGIVKTVSADSYYVLPVFCQNCYHKADMRIAKRTALEQAKLRCPNCECGEQLARDHHKLTSGEVQHPFPAGTPVEGIVR